MESFYTIIALITVGVSLAAELVTFPQVCIKTGKPRLNGAVGQGQATEGRISRLSFHLSRNDATFMANIALV